MENCYRHLQRLFAGDPVWFLLCFFVAVNDNPQTRHPQRLFAGDPVWLKTNIFHPIKNKPKLFLRGQALTHI